MEEGAEVVLLAHGEPGAAGGFLALTYGRTEDVLIVLSFDIVFNEHGYY